MKQNKLMDAKDAYKHFSALEVENELLKDQLKSLGDRSFNSDKFYSVALNTSTVALLHNVRPERVRKYVKHGCIETHPDSTDSNILIRASVALTLDFKELRKNFNRRTYENNSHSRRL